MPASESHTNSHAQYRILVLGGICGGKTHFSKRLSERLKISVLHLDDLFWFGNWRNIGSRRLVEAVREQTRTGEWIVDGNYPSVRDVLWREASHIVYLDTPLRQAAGSAIARSLGDERAGVPAKVRAAGGREPTLRLLKSVLGHRISERRRDLKWLRRLPSGPPPQVMVLKSRAEQERALAVWFPARVLWGGKPEDAAAGEGSIDNEQA